MKVERKQVEQVTITGAERLDTVHATLEDISPGKGRITIECYGEAWSASWGGMGADRTVAQFFCSCNDDYLAGNLSSLEASIVDEDEIKNSLRRIVLKDLRSKEIDRFEARQLFDQISILQTSDVLTGYNHSSADRDLLVMAFGDDWWQGLPTKVNPDYAYLLRIINAVKEGLGK